MNRTIDLKRGKKSEVPHPTALIADNHVPTDEQVGSLVRFARWVVENGIAGGCTSSEGALVEASERSELRPLAPFPTCASDTRLIPSEGPAKDTESGGALGEASERSELRPLAPFPTALFQVARDILLRRAPRLKGASIEELTSQKSLLEAQRSWTRLDSSALPIQGPPGSGKTFTGAHMIMKLVEKGKRVGVTAGSHKVISNLLSTLCEEVARPTSR